MACLTCAHLSVSLAQFELGLLGSLSYGGPRDFLLGTLAKLEERSSCDSCRSVTEIAANPSSSDAPVPPSTSTITAHFSRASLRFFLLIGDLPGILPSDFSARRNSLHQLIHRPCYSTLRTAPNEPRGRLTTSTFDTALITRWINHCNTFHPHTCTRKYDLYMLPEARLSFLDTSSLCIVTPAPSPSLHYVALSYVWGTFPVLRTLKSNLARLQQPGAFALPEFQLPKTIRDAVTLCQQLGIRYLWVDSLCIVQDDPVSQQEQLRAMGSVYGKAHFTIAALRAEHAGAGIYRVEEAGRPQQVIRLPGRPLVVANSRAAVGLSVLNAPEVKWSSRGWTLQEHVFSRRILALGEVATWVCFGDQWTEDVESATELEEGNAAAAAASDAVTAEFKLGPVTWPSIRAYAELAGEYATRDLTYASDTVNAFAGILTPMAAWFPGGLLFGVAEFTFDAGLLWDVRRSGAVMRSGSPSAEGVAPFPSWSWISWQGSLLFKAWSEGEDYSFPRGPVAIKPLVRWQKRLVSTGAWVDIDNSYHRVRAHFDPAKESPAPVPTGWIKKVDEASGEAFYQNESHDHILPNPRFSYPIPPFVRPRDIDRETYYPYIRFRGGRKLMRISIPAPEVMRLSKKLQDGGLVAEADLVTYRGDWAGRMTLNIPKGGRLPASNEPIELIAVSESDLDLSRAAHARFIFQEVTQRSELLDLDVYEVMNVLWIGRCAGEMVYRKALGRVWKRLWIEEDQVELLLT